MTDDESIEEPDESEGESELTPEEQEQLQEMIRRWSRTFGPRIQFKLPEIEWLGKIAAHQSKIFESLKPALAIHDAWQQQFKVVDSDVFKRMALVQSNLNDITARLTKNVDFGLGATTAKLAQQLATQQSEWLKALPSFESLKLAFYPPNLRTIEGLRLEQVESVVMVDGIALYGVPRTSIAAALVRADTAAKRRDVLGRRWKAISADCRAAVEGCETDEVRAYVPVALAALDALDGGHSAAAQALTGALLDAMVNSYFGDDRCLYTPDKRGNRTTAAYDEFSVHKYIALAPIWQAWQKFFPAEGLPIPHTFSRNATAHTVSPKQYTKRNAAQSLMIASGLIYFFDREALQVKAA